jgi:hypothetical protein
MSVHMVCMSDIRLMQSDFLPMQQNVPINHLGFTVSSQKKQQYP